MTPEQAKRRCTKCDRLPSGLIPRAHDFCEFCGERLPVVEPECVPATCYRCGKKFETVAGNTICPECQQHPAVEAAPLPEDPENNFLTSAIWGALFPLAVRIIYGMGMNGLPASNEAKALSGVFAFFAALCVLAVIGVVGALLRLWPKPTKPSAVEQAITWAAFAVTTALLWALT